MNIKMSAAELECRYCQRNVAKLRKILSEFTRDGVFKKLSCKAGHVYNLITEEEFSRMEGDVVVI